MSSVRCVQTEALERCRVGYQCCGKRIHANASILSHFVQSVEHRSGIRCRKTKRTQHLLNTINRGIDVRVIECSELDELSRETFQFVSSQPETRVDLADRSARRFKRCRNRCGDVLGTRLHVFQLVACHSGLFDDNVQPCVDFLERSHRRGTHSQDRSSYAL